MRTECEPMGPVIVRSRWAAAAVIGKSGEMELGGKMSWTEEGIGMGIEPTCDQTEVEE